MFGLNGSFSINDNKSSVQLYANKYNKSKEQQKKIKKQAKSIEKKLMSTMSYAISTHLKTLPNLVNVLNPSIDVAYDLQYEIGNLNLVEVDFTEIGLYVGQLCNKAETGLFHTELDQGYTLVGVPEQENGRKRGLELLFRINDKVIIVVEMVPMISFVFSAAILTHRQNCREHNGDDFLNYSSFCNLKLFNHLRKSFSRVMVSEDNNC